MNVCVGAASLAYEPGGTIAMRHLLHAAKRELQKLGQQYSESDFALARIHRRARRPAAERTMNDQTIPDVSKTLVDLLKRTLTDVATRLRCRRRRTPGTTC